VPPERPPHPLDRLRGGGLRGGILRVGLGALVLGLVLYLGGADAWTRVARPEVIPWLVAGALTHLLQRTVRIAKWADMLAETPLRRRDFRYLLQTQLIGMLANLIIPVSEAVKVWAISRDRTDAVIGSTSIVGDTAMHAAGMGATGVIGAALIGSHEPVILAGGGALLGLSIVAVLVCRMWPKVARGRVRYGRSRTWFWLLWEVALQCITYGLAFRAIGLELPTATIMAIAPLLYLADIVMVTPSGLGVREGLFAAVLQLVEGAAPDAAIAVGLMVSAMMFGASLLGGVGGLILSGRFGD